ncbi:MAG: hypothetical protein WB245_09195 [Acidimicrobiia bacterium]
MGLVVVVLEAASGRVVGAGSEPSRGHSAQIPTARPTKIRPAISRRITALANLRHRATRVKGHGPHREN